MKHIAPILLIRELAQSVPIQEADLIEHFHLEAVKQRRNGTKIKISFYPTQESINKTMTKSGTRWTRGDGGIEFETLRCILQRYVPSIWSSSDDLSNTKRGAKRKSSEHSEPNSSVHPHKKTTSYLSPRPTQPFTITPNTTNRPAATRYPVQIPTSEHYPRNQGFRQPGYYDGSSATIKLPTRITPGNDLQLPLILSRAEPYLDRDGVENSASEDDDLERAIALSLADQQLQLSKLSPLSSKLTSQPIHTNRNTSLPNVSSFGQMLDIDRKQMEQEGLARLDRVQRADSSPLQRPGLASFSNSVMWPFRIAQENDITGPANTNTTRNQAPLKDLDKIAPVRRPRTLELTSTYTPVIDLTDD